MWEAVNPTTEQVPGQPYFVAACTYTKEYLTLMHRKVSRTGLLAAIYFALAAVWLINAMLSADEASQMLNSTYTLLFLAMGVMVLLRPSGKAKQLHQVNMMLYGQPVEQRQWFYANHLVEVTTPSGGQTAIAYTTIRSVVTTPLLYFLCLPHGAVVIVDRRRFEYGAEERFLAFLMSRNPAIKMR